MSGFLGPVHRYQSYSNRFIDACIRVFDEINKILLDNNFMYVHYSRLLQVEIDNIKTNGLKILTPQLVSEKLKYIENKNILDSTTIRTLRDESNKAFGDRILFYIGNRQNMLWVTTLKDTCNDYDGIIHLLNNWGGENIYKGERDSGLLKFIGYPAIVAIKISFDRLNDLFKNNKYNIAYGIVKNYVYTVYDRFFEISVCEWNNQEFCFNNINEFSIKTDIKADHIVEIYKLGDEFFNNTIHGNITQDLYMPQTL